MAGTVGTSNNRISAPLAASPEWLSAARREALISSNTMLRDRFERSSSTLGEIRKTFSDPQATLGARGAVMASAGRELTRTIKTTEDLGSQLNVILGDSPTYQNVVNSAVGQGFMTVTKATVATVGPVAETAGAIADLTRAQSQAVSDFAAMQHVLADAHATTALKIAATARATQSASAFVTQQRTTLQVIQQADVDYQSNPAYQKLTANMRESGSLRLLSRVNGFLKPSFVKAAAVAGTGAGFVLGVVTLPTMIRGVQSSFAKLQTTLSDAKSTHDQKLDAIADLSRASAGSVQGVEGMRRSIEGLTQYAAESKSLGAITARVQSIGLVSETASWFTKIMRVLSPIADVGMLVADGVKLKHVWDDPKANGWSKARAILSVGLDGLKLGTWLMPQTALVRVGYLGASFMQLGIAAYDFSNGFLPFMTKVGHGVTQAFTHPQEAMRAAGQALGEGLTYVSQSIYRAAGALAFGLAHPAEAMQAVGQKLHDWWSGAQQVGGVLKESALEVKGGAASKTAMSPVAPSPGAVPTPPALPSLP